MTSLNEEYINYSDDPDFSETVTSKKKNPIIFAVGAAVLAGLFFLQTTLAANINFNSGMAVEFGQGMSMMTACSGANSIRLEPKANFTSGAFYFTSLTVSNIPDDCRGFDFQIYIYGSTGNTALSAFNTTSSRAVIYNNAGQFELAYGQAGYTITSRSGSFTINVTSPSVLSSDVAKIAIQTSAHNFVTVCCSFVRTTLPNNGFAPVPNADGEIKFAISYSANVFTSNDLGVTWIDNGQLSSVSNGVSYGPGGFSAVAYSSDANFIAVAGDYAFGADIFTSADGGFNWLRTSAPSSRWRGLTSSASGQYLFAIESGLDFSGGYIYTSSDFGVTWSQKTSAGSRVWSDIDSSNDGQFLVATTSSADVYVSTDYGVTWASKLQYPGYWNDTTISSDGRIMFAAGRGGFYRSTNFGVDWTWLPSQSRMMDSLSMSSNGQFLAALARNPSNMSIGFIVTSTDSGLTWTNQEIAGEFSWSNITVSTDGSIYYASKYDNPGGVFKGTFTAR